MDPEENLREQRELASRILKECRNAEEPEESQSFSYDAERLAELVQALDGWIKGGGFLPKDWQKNPSKST